MPEKEQSAIAEPILDANVTETPTIYCNQFAASISFSDIRLYVAEVTPKDVTFAGKKGFRTREPHVRPHVCVVLTPEYSRVILTSLQEAIERYEQTFGPLRTPPTPEHVFKALNDPQGTNE